MRLLAVHRSRTTHTREDTLIPGIVTAASQAFSQKLEATQITVRENIAEGDIRLADIALVVIVSSSMEDVRWVFSMVTQCNKAGKDPLVIAHCEYAKLMLEIALDQSRCSIAMFGQEDDSLTAISQALSASTATV